MAEKKEIKSRRARPAKAPLSRESIVDQAVEILTRDGLDGLSLRKIAAALDTGAASLYVYVANLEELKSLILDRALGEVEIPPKSKSSWRARLKTTIWSYMKVLTARPGLGQLAVSAVSTGPNTFRLMETIVSLLLEGGLDQRTAAWALDAILVHASAVSAEQDARREQGYPWERMRQAIDGLDPKAYPNMARLGQSLILSGEGETRGHWAMEFMINGLLTTPIE
ncbi:MAG: TetR/AcrR family transcriptional regulator C-terminal domain-containing protein [Candidatus Adiutrix sp.]|jgi:AcrR family transcriptional regulator|nr:TetR/AcrR family transcriptional regulator C-terminal domain-containing protein [Candidatus Adiutrix sp.]